MANPENMHVAQTQGGGGGFFGGLGSALVGTFCVAEGSNIETPYGKMYVQDVCRGDEVLNGNHETVKVTATTGPHEEDVFEVETATHKACMTSTQPVMGEDDWIYAGDLQPGDIIQTSNGYEEVEEIHSAGRINVYDLKVEGENPSYIADGIVVKAGENEWE